LDLYLKYRATEVGNVALDSFLLRARLLIDFFYKPSAKPDDVIALDFFHDFNPKPYKPRMTKALEREREKINKRLMHLTTKPMPRLRSNQRYALDKITLPIVAAFRKWLLVVPDGRLQTPPRISREHFETHISRIEKLIPPHPAGKLSIVARYWSIDYRPNWSTRSQWRREGLLLMGWSLKDWGQASSISSIGSSSSLGLPRRAR
jgi:hypothetical protein